MVYAYNWYDVGAVLPLIGSGLHAGPVELGVVLGAFLLGVGLFQIPAGIAALRIGRRRVSLLGLLLLGVSSAACAVAPTWEILAALRFAGGVGAALFFSPALSLIASYFPEGRRGPVIGLYNGGFSVGGTAGLFVGALCGAAFGWPVALASGGIALLAATGVCAVLLPPEPPSPWEGDRVAERAVIGSILRSRSTWALAFALAGFWAAIYDVAQYFVAFGTTVHPTWPVGLAAGLAALVVLVSFPAGPLGGWIAERSSRRRLLLTALAGATAVAVAAIPWLPYYALVTDLIALGALDGMAFAVLYLLPTYFAESRGAGLALGVALINGVQVALGSGLAVVFAWIVSFAGYTDAWVFAGVTTLVTLPLLGLSTGIRPSKGSAIPGAAPGKGA